jgi:hypothetical protein
MVADPSVPAFPRPPHFTALLTEKTLALTQQEPERQFLQERIRQLK